MFLGLSVVSCSDHFWEPISFRRLSQFENSCSGVTLNLSVYAPTYILKCTQYIHVWVGISPLIWRSCFYRYKCWLRDTKRVCATFESIEYAALVLNWVLGDLFILCCDICTCFLMQPILDYVSLFRRVVRTGPNKKDSSPIVYNSVFPCHLISNCVYFSVLEVYGVWDDYAICRAHWDISESERWSSDYAVRTSGFSPHCPGPAGKEGHACGALPGIVLI